MRVFDWVKGHALQLRRDRGACAWMALVAFVYGTATFVRSQATPDFGTDHMMSLASNLLVGRSDLGHSQLTTINDIVTIATSSGDRYYQAFSLLPTIPYLSLVPFPELWPLSRFLVSAGLGIMAGWLALPLARRYGPGGGAEYWLASLGAFGTLLFTLTIEGDFYYLAHLEAAILTFLALIEWKDRRRPWVLGLLIGLAGLARPTLWLVAIPFGLGLLADVADVADADEIDADEAGVDAADSEDAADWPASYRFDIRARLMVAIGFAIPLLAAVAVTGWWDWVRFGSATETGYGIAWITPPLEKLRAEGLFSIMHLPTNLALFIGGGYGVRDTFPWLVPSNQGQSILLTMPALLIAFAVSMRERLNKVLWGAVIVTAIPVFLYYGGGGANTYGYRYAMDFVPFLVALVAVALKNRFGNMEKMLIILSVCFVSYGYVWLTFK
ncbi:MAG TPA: hypothetical protein VF337_12105 [Candidatus Limnocylindrales bacterium]